MGTPVKMLMRTTALSGAAFLFAVSAGSSANAQTTGGAVDDDAERIVITGSRISRAGFDTLQPAVQVDSDLIEARSFTSPADVLNEVPAFGDPSSGTNVGGQSGQTLGSAFVNAFGLGTQRTLTLLNGRRVVGQNRVTTGFAGAGGAGQGASLGLQVDLNIIPTALVDRIETIFIGGAPIYGADAVAGTVNVILKDDYEGFEADAQYGQAQTGMGDTFRFSTLLGGNFGDGRGNVVMGADYINTEEIIAADAGFLTRQQSSNPANTGPMDGQPDNILIERTENIWGVPNTGAPLPTPGFWTGPLGGGNTFWKDVNNNGVFGDAGDESYFFNLDGSLTTYEDQINILGPNINNAFFAAGGRCFESDLCVELTEVNTVQTGSDRWNFTSIGHYEITDNLRYIFEGNFSRTIIDTPTQPAWSSFTFNPVSLIQVRLDNPFLDPVVAAEFADQLPDADDDGNPDPNIDTDHDGTPDAVGFFLTRSNRDLTGNDRQSRSQNIMRFVQGLEGDFDAMGRAWEWDLAYVFGQTLATSRQQVVNFDRFSNALDAVRLDNGDIVCRVTIDEDGDGQPDSDPSSQTSFQAPNTIADGRNDVAGCVPFNPFGYNPDQTAAREFILGETIQETTVQQMYVDANIVGQVFDLPAGPVDFAAGFTHRREKGEFAVDAFTQFQPDGGDPVLPVTGKYNTTEIYAETVFPIFGDGVSPTPFIDSFQGEAAARFVDNNVAGEDTTWTAGGRVRFAEIPFIGNGLQIRGNYTQSVRAPSIVELFAPRQAQGIFANDPCDMRFIDEGPNPSVRRANCEAQVAGLITAGQLDPGFDLDSFQSLITNSTQRSFTGGNTDLQNEVADSWTVGGVITPEFIDGLTISVDWTRIRLNDAIINITGTQLLAACYDTANLSAPECDRFTRSNTFQVIDPITGFTNAALRDFAGLVAEVDWDIDMSEIPYTDGQLPGQLNLNGQFFHTHRHEQSTTSEDLDIFAGEGGFEKFRFQVNATYDLDRLSMLWQARYIGGGIQRQLAAPETFQFPNFPSTLINNFGLRYELTDNFTARLTIQNVFDKQDSPRLQAGLTDDSGNFGRFRDVIGRRWIVGMNASF